MQQLLEKYLTERLCLWWGSVTVNKVEQRYKRIRVPRRLNPKVAAECHQRYRDRKWLVARLPGAWAGRCTRRAVFQLPIAARRPACAQVTDARWKRGAECAYAAILGVVWFFKYLYLMPSIFNCLVDSGTSEIPKLAATRDKMETIWWSLLTYLRSKPVLLAGISDCSI